MSEQTASGSYALHMEGVERAELLQERITNAGGKMSELGYCDVPHKLGDPTPDGKALYQIAHQQSEGCENWKSVQSHHRELTGRIAEAKAILSAIKWNEDGPVQKALKVLEGK